MFHEFSSVPPRQPSLNVFKDVEDLLHARGLTLGTFLVSVLRDTKTSLGATVKTELADILHALRPHFDEDDKARVLLGEFFTSVVSPELLRFEKGDDRTSWNLPATNLSTDQLMKFNLDTMGRRINSDAPGLSSFLDRICNRQKLDSSNMDVDDDGKDDTEDDDKDDTEDDVEGESGTEARQKVSRAQLLEIVRYFARCIFMAHSAIEEGYHCEYYIEHPQSEVQRISGRDWCFPPFDTHAIPRHPHSPSHRYQYFFDQHLARHQIHVSKDD